ncbi:MULTISPECIES: hypothetical protein [Streptomyces]|uniref:hypothetical protein n=1 Tax=Streptomyces TaxID=1883 RepID=UPI001319CC86|nr:hypothetical protein [Streptomyces sp. PAMC 26508]
MGGEREIQGGGLYLEASAAVEEQASVFLDDWLRHVLHGHHVLLVTAAVWASIRLIGFF